MRIAIYLSLFMTLLFSASLNVLQNNAIETLNKELASQSFLMDRIGKTLIHERAVGAYKNRSLITNSELLSSKLSDKKE